VIATVGRQPQFFQLVEASCAIPNMLKDGVRTEGRRCLCQRCQRWPPRTTDTFGIGMLLVHSATECGDQIVKFFLAAHNQLLS
jgi:hypothetical protein